MSNPIASPLNLRTGGGGSMRRALVALMALSLLAGLLTIGASGPVSAQTADEPADERLVSNIDEAGDSSTSFGFFDDHAQGFRTGDDPRYELTSVELDIRVVDLTNTNFTVAIHTPDEHGNPGDELAELKAPAELTDGVNEFTYAAGLKLEPLTRYFVVVDVQSAGAVAERNGVRLTASDDDSGADGWLINNGSRNRSWNATAWSKDAAHAYKMRVNGVPADPAWIVDGFSLVNVFQVDRKSTLTLPAAKGEGPLTYSLLDTRNNDSEPHPTTLTLPPGLMFDAETRTISGTPTAAYTGVYTYIVTDADGDSKRFPFLLEADPAAEFASVSVTAPTDALELLDVNWTPSADAEVTGYLVQWKSGDQEYSDSERRYTAGSSDASYQITDLEPGTEYRVRVTQQGGVYDQDDLERTASTPATRQVTVVRGGPAQTYRVKLNSQPPVRVAMYPKQDPDDDFAYLKWDSGEELSAWPVMHFFTPSAPSADELAGRFPAAQWNTYKEFSVSAPVDSGTGTVTLYHGFIWSDDVTHSGFSAGTTTVTIVDPPAEAIAATIAGDATVAEGASTTFDVGLSAAAPEGGLTVGVRVAHVSRHRVVYETMETVTVLESETTASLSVTAVNIDDRYPYETDDPLTRSVYAAITQSEDYVLGTPWYAWVPVTESAVVDEVVDESPAGDGDDGGEKAPSGETLPDPAVLSQFVVYHDPDAGAAAVDRFTRAIALLDDAGVSYSLVSGDVRDEASRLAGVSSSVMPRFFFGDPTGDDWVSEKKVNNGGLRWLQKKLAALSAD